MRTSQNGPMSLDVSRTLRAEIVEHSEYVRCGTCATGCPRDTIRYPFSHR